MRTEAIFELRRELPDLNADAFLLLIFIMFRAEGSKFEDDNGTKYVLLSGNNDPAVALGWSQHKVKRMKRELREANLITSSWNGFGNPYRVYVTLSVGANLRRRKSATTQDTTDENPPSRKVQICTPVGCKSAPTASYIRKTKKKDQEERPRATASQSPRPTGLPPEFWEAYEQECRKEEAAKMRKEKKDDQEGSDGSDDLPTEIL